MRSPGEVLRSVKNGNIDSIYFFLGDDYYLQNLLIREISKMIFNKIDENKTFLSPDDMKSEEIIDRITQSDLFSTKKFLILRNPGNLRNKARSDFISYCKNPTLSNYLIIIEDDFSDRKSITKELKKINNTVSVQTPFPNEIRKWTKFMLSEKNISYKDNVLDTIIEVAGDSLFHIENEIEKISLNINDGEEITKESIDQLSGWKMQYKRWQFFQILGKRDLDKSLVLGLSLLNQGNTMISLMYPLTAFFQELFYIKNNSGTFANKNSYIPLPPSVIKELPQIANRFNKEEIEYALAILGKIDQRLKTTSLSDEALFTHFLFSVLQANG
ncbi:MAG: DNA polymerase III subunit delta [Candidatus Neomarinimicrobiota bacterium]|tara:strand:+ start:408 stop:1394 length:987 start_codon:yes stop_codon:yes gene_type:complete